MAWKKSGTVEGGGTVTGTLLTFWFTGCTGLVHESLRRLFEFS